jgi:hypothetical protein
VGIIQVFDYKVRKPNAAQVAMQHIAATRAGAWLAEAAASKLRAEALAEFLASWESEHSVLTLEEIARAEHELGLSAGETAA